MDIAVDYKLAEFIRQINLLDLDEKIRKFRRLDIRNMTTEMIFNEILDVLKFEGKFIYAHQFSIYKEKTQFFRVRQLEGSRIPNKSLMNEQDFWNPPEKCAKKYGRLNKSGQSLLYTSPINPYIAKMEAKVEQDAFYAVIVYEAIEDIKVNMIVAIYNYENMGIKDEHSTLVNNRINDFLIQ